MDSVNIIFNCSLPRAMSTLLQNILAQNPTIYSTGTDPSFEFIYAARANLSLPESKAMNQKALLEAYHSFCREGWKAYAKSLAKDKSNIILKHRGITSNYNVVKNILGERPRIIQMVRDVRSIFSSFEKIFRQNQTYPNLFDENKMHGTTTSKRVDFWAKSPPIGSSLERLQQLILEGNDAHVLFVRAEDLTRDPRAEMKRIYAYLNLEFFEHDFSNVAQFIEEDDAAYGLQVKIHETRLKVAPVKPDYVEILGQEVSNNLHEYYSWYQNKFGYKK